MYAEGQQNRHYRISYTFYFQQHVSYMRGRFCSGGFCLFFCVSRHVSDCRLLAELMTRFVSIYLRPDAAFLSLSVFLPLSLRRHRQKTQAAHSPWNQPNKNARLNLRGIMFQLSNAALTNDSERMVPTGHSLVDDDDNSVEQFDAHRPHRQLLWTTHSAVCKGQLRESVKYSGMKHQARTTTSKPPPQWSALPRDGDVFLFVCLSVCLSVCLFVCRRKRGRHHYCLIIMFPPRVKKNSREIYARGGGLLVTS